MAGKYLDRDLVDITFNAWWDLKGRTTATIGEALRETKDQIQGPMPPGYTPPPLRKRVALESKAIPDEADAAKARLNAAQGRQRVQEDLNKLAQSVYPDLPPHVARALYHMPCFVDPKERVKYVKKTISSHWNDIESYNRKSPVASQGPKRDIDKEYERRQVEREAIAAMKRSSIVYSGRNGTRLAKEVLANKTAMMLLDQNYLGANTLAAGFYGIARAMGADHDSAMKIGSSSQNILQVVAIGSGIGARGNMKTYGTPPPSGLRTAKKGSYFRQSGMPKTHFDVFKATAKESKKIVLVRFTKTASIKLIEIGAPSKGMELSKAGIKCDSATGVATAQNKAQIGSARKLGFFVVDADGVARNQNGETIAIKAHNAWKVKPGQVVDRSSKLPVTGDYDLLDVIDPVAKGRRLVLASSNGKTLPDQSNPLVRAMRSQINGKLDQPRVLHGAHGDFSGLPNEGAIVFGIDGTATLLPTRAAVQAYYEAIGRATVKGTHHGGGKATPGSE